MPKEYREPTKKHRKALQITRKKYSGDVWEQDAAGSNPVTRTNTH